MGALSPWHLLLVLGIALIVLGPGKLPETGAAIGRAIRSFQDAVNGHDESTVARSAVVVGATAPAPPAAPMTSAGASGAAGAATASAAQAAAQPAPSERQAG